MQVPYLGRAPRTKETLPDFLKWRRVTRHPLVFRGLTGSQRTPGFWGITSRVVSRAPQCPCRALTYCSACGTVTTWALCRDGLYHDKEPKISILTEKPKWAVAHCFCSSLPLQFFSCISSNPTTSIKFIQTINGPRNINSALEQSRN